MGAVHGVYLKYVGLSALSYAGYAAVSTEPGESLVFEAILRLCRLAGVKVTTDYTMSLFRAAPALALGYSSALNGLIALLFKLRRGMGMLGKCPETGRIPLWSYALFFPFHAPTALYTHVHTRVMRHKRKLPNGKSVREIVPVASEVQPGWWVGGCYAHELDRDWGGVIDLTVEFPERLEGRTASYMLVPTWDGVPPTPEQLEEAADFAVEARKKGDVIVHCAHGRGRSTTVMCACLVRAGLFPTWEEAFEKGIKPGRSVCKLNRAMKSALTEWQSQYVNVKKDE
uniref:Tyrosine specific protein phosphatases domain-containing protein n=1 Tax=Trieres chinensis TaxID=1514140 RepID=A0A7S1ZW92_TRICV